MSLKKSASVLGTVTWQRNVIITSASFQCSANACEHQTTVYANAKRAYSWVYAWKEY